MTVSLLLTFAASLALAAAAPAVDDYDATLCERAQLLVTGEPPVEVEVITGESNGFHTIQMDIDVERRRVITAATTMTTEVDGETLVTGVGCKMVNAERVADVLQVRPTSRPFTCGEVNQATYGYVFNALPFPDKRRYLTEGVQLRFAPDYIAATGGEWLPVRIEDHIVAVPAADGTVDHLQISAPSVRVPWDSETREFYQGTQHCKLISAAAMRRWMLVGAFDGSTELFPIAQQACTAPSAESSAAGSCMFWFAPAQSMFCKDYTGAGWTAETARAECGKRHASPEALAAASSRYEGEGGVYQQAACTGRADAEPLGGTCVFNCNAPDESLWRQSGDSPMQGGGAMTRACDLYIE